jgi:hypothetical protein
MLEAEREDLAAGLDEIVREGLRCYLPITGVSPPGPKGPAHSPTR